VHAPPPPFIIPPETLLLGYRAGIFPMADSRDDPEVFWVEPKMRAVLPLDQFHLSHSLARTLRRGRLAVTCNQAFAEVVEACAAPRSCDGGESWISHRIAASYQHLHALGAAHSIECWQPGGDGGRRLVGGLYGVGFDRVFCGESMFSRATDASKVALAWLVAAMREARLELLDCQFITPHLASLGAIEMPQERYLELLRSACRPYVDEGFGVGLGEGLGEGLSDGLADGFGAGLSSALASDVPSGFAAVLAAAEAVADGAGASSPGNFIAQLLTQTS